MTVGRSRHGVGGDAGLRWLVTGATGGIGGAVARALGGEGARLALQGRDADALGAVAEATGGVALPADLAQPGEPDRLVEWAEAALGGIDVLVDCAGAGWAGSFAAMPSERIDELVALDLVAPLRLARAVVGPMRARGWGRIVLVGSVAGHLGVPGEAAYAAAKGGLVAFAEALRAELRGTGVAVTLVSPAVIATRFFERRRDDVTAAGEQPASAGTALESSGAAVPADPLAASLTRPRGGATGSADVAAVPSAATPASRVGGGAGIKQLPADPLTRRVPRPQPPEAVAAAIVRAVRSPSPPAELFVPRWMRLPVRLRGALPGLYRRLAALDSTYKAALADGPPAGERLDSSDPAESRKQPDAVDRAALTEQAEFTERREGVSP